MSTCTTRIFMLFFALLFAGQALHAGAADFSIRLGHNSARERAAEQQLRTILNTYDVSSYSFTYSIRINEGDVPHSHPVLTLNTVHLGDDANALSTFLHEQLHWYSLIMSTETEAAVKALKEIYPHVPVGRGQGAADEYSTYVHLIVGLQEYDALASYVGRAEAKRVILSKPHYQWIYKQVLTKTERLRTLLARHQLAEPCF